jgi:hypothetical protein
MDSKKGAARAAKDVRAPVMSEARTGTRNTERSQILSKRPSAPPPDVAAAAKKREKSSFPPPMADNDNAARKAPVASIGRGRLPTGSLHTEARVPVEAEAIKVRLTALVNTQQKLAELKRSSQKHFYEIGQLLHKVREQRLYEVKGYGSFEAFIDREVNLGQQFCLQSVRIYETFMPGAVAAYGFHKLATALEALDQAVGPANAADVARMARSHIPPHKL